MTGIRRARTGRRTRTGFTAGIGFAICGSLITSVFVAPAAFADDEPTQIIPPGSVSIVGELQVGEVIEVPTDGWEPATTDVSVVWFADDVVITEPEGDRADARLTLSVDELDTTITARLTGSLGELPTVTVDAVSDEIVGVGEFSEVPTVQIVGSPTVGNTLTVAAGEWTPAAESIEIEWLMNGVALPGRHASTLVLAPDFVDAEISVRVTAVRPGYAGSSVVANAGVVLAATFDPAAVTPTINGDVRVHHEVTASLGSIPEGTRVEYRWLRDGVVIDNAVDATYAIVYADMKKALSVRVFVSGPGYVDTEATSAPTRVTADTFQVSPVPTISGVARVDAVLSAVPGDWTQNPTLTYQWRRDGAAISGAVKPNYRATAKDLGHRVSVTVTGKSQGISSVSRTSASVAIGAGAFTSVSAPRISGIQRVGKTLTATVSAWAPTATFTFQWKRNGVAIPGATKPTYVLTTADGGTNISVAVAGRRANYKTTFKDSVSVGPIVRVFAAAPSPTISGNTRVMSTLTGNPGTWKPGATTVAFQWYRNGQSIPGATGRTYKLSSDDYGKRITFSVTAGRAGWVTTKRTSGPTVVITGPNASIVGNGTFRVGTQMKPGTYVSPGGSGCYWERRSNPGDDFDGIIANDFTAGGQVIVTISSTDRFFTTDRCGSWTPMVRLGPLRSAVSDGQYAVNVHVRPGSWVSSGGNGCYWARTDGFGGEFSEIIDNSFTYFERQTVYISPGEGFQTSRCGTWRWVGY